MSCEIACTTPISQVKSDTTCLLNGLQTDCRTACLEPGFYFNSTLRMVTCNPWPNVDGIGCSDSNYTGRVLGMINDCMSQYCQFPNADVRGCPYENISESSLNAQYGLSWCAYPRIASGFLNGSPSCKQLVGTVNPDIGGVGVSRPIDYLKF
jgi:hypothetical protein